MPGMNWKPEYEVTEDTMIFHGIDTLEKRLAMIKAYESLEGLSYENR